MGTNTGVKKNKKEKRRAVTVRIIVIIVIALMLFMALAGSFSWFASGSENGAYALQISEKSEGLNVNFRTQKEISDYYNSHPSDLDVLSLNGTSVNGYATSYKAAPGLARTPYTPGELTDQELIDALNVLKTVRFIAGISDDVTLNSEYNRRAQAAALVSYANGLISHEPDFPLTVAEDTAILGVEACGNSLLGKVNRENYSLEWSILFGWMEDSDSKNISELGHRRWALNPSLGSVGFGLVSDNGFSYSAMYANDYSGADSDYSNVAWPAQNTPTSMFARSSAWTLSVGSVIQNPETVTVSLEKTKAMGKTIYSSAFPTKWSFYGAQYESEGTYKGFSSDGQFYVNNLVCGTPGCIIFKPNSTISYEPGDQYKVSVFVDGRTIEYTVDFFDIYNPEEEVKPLTEEEKQEQEKAQAEKNEALVNGVKNTTIKLTSSKTSKGIKLTWTKSLGYKMDYYEVFRSNKKSSGYGTKAYYSTKGLSNASTKQNYTNTKGLVKGKTYYYKVRGVRVIDGVNIYSQWSTKAYRKW